MAEDPENPDIAVTAADDAGAHFLVPSSSALITQIVYTRFPLPSTVSEIKVYLVQPNIAVDMISNLWKRARPNKPEDQVPQKYIFPAIVYTPLRNTITGVDTATETTQGSLIEFRCVGVATELK